MASRNPNTLMAIPDDTFDFLFKVVLIGDCGTGKTCVVQRFKTGSYGKRHGNTIGVDFSMKTINIDAKRVKVRFLNTNICITYIFTQIGNTIENRNIHSNTRCFEYAIYIFFATNNNCIHFYLDTNMGHCWPGAISNDNAELLSISKRSYYR